MILPVRLSLDSSEPRITARSSPARMSRTSKLMRSIMARESLTKSVIAALPDFRPIHGRTPVSPAISHSTLSLNSLAISAGSAPLPMRPRNSCARRRLSFWLMGSVWLSDCWRDIRVGKPGVTDCSEGRKEGVKPFDHRGMGKARVTEFGRRHSRNQECLHSSDHLTGLGSQNSASKDSLSRFFDRSFQKPIHLAGSSCPRHRERSDRDLKNLNL